MAFVSRAAHGLKPPHVAKELLLAEDAVGLRRQGAQQGELLVGELDAPLSDPDLARRGVDEQLADPARPLATRRAAAQDVLDPRGELGVVKRLDEVIVGPGQQAATRSASEERPLSTITGSSGS